MKLLKDIVIPAGTPVDIGPSDIALFVPHAWVCIGPTKDTVYNWYMDLEEAKEQGFVG